MIATFSSITVILFCFNVNLCAQNVIIVVVDGARYSETFGAIDPLQTIPHLWNDLKPQGTLYTNFRIAHEGETVTNPGHATVATGTWQHISNAGGAYPDNPTILECFRKELGASETDNFMIAGKSKLEWIKHSDYPGYGVDYQATWSGNDSHNDANVYDLLISAMYNVMPNAPPPPRLIIVNFPETDTKGHTGVWNDYITAIVNVDNLIYQLWTKIQEDIPDNFYKDNTTLFITNDHGRHTDGVNGGFSGHGDDCDGCEHIMCLALGKHVSPNQVINLPTFQRDIAPTVGTLLGFETPYVSGQNLYGIDPPLPVELLSFSASVTESGIKLNWRTETEVNNYGFDIERTPLSPPFLIGGKKEEWEKIGFVEGYGNSNSVKDYSFLDDDIISSSYLYRLKQIDNDGTYEYSNVIEIVVDGVPGMFALEQNYPNPFNPVTTINYSLPVKSKVRLVVYNVLGENVIQLVNEVKEAGSYSVELNATGLPGGVHFYDLQTEFYVETRKMVILK
jgi:hypothetical protein